VAHGGLGPPMIQVLARVVPPRFSHHGKAVPSSARRITTPASRSARPLHAAPRVPHPRSARAPRYHRPGHSVPSSGPPEQAARVSGLVVATAAGNGRLAPGAVGATCSPTAASHRTGRARRTTARRWARPLTTEMCDVPHWSPPGWAGDTRNVGGDLGALDRARTL
jgi:hypothetical protein